MKNLEATKLVRQALVEAGANSDEMYTNKYKTMRTVKAYLNKDKRAVAKLKKALEKHFGDAAPEFEFTAGYYSWSWDGVIVRLPYNKFEDAPIEVDADTAARREANRKHKATVRINNRIADLEDSLRYHNKSAQLKREAIARLKAELRALG